MIMSLTLYLDPKIVEYTWNQFFFLSCAGAKQFFFLSLFNKIKILLTHKNQVFAFFILQKVYIYRVIITPKMYGDNYYNIFKEE